MTQNPTTPEDDQHSRVDNAAQAPSSGHGKDAQANAAGDSQGTGPLSFDRAAANRQDASSRRKAPQDSHSAGSAYDHAYSSLVRPLVRFCPAGLRPERRQPGWRQGQRQAQRTGHALLMAARAANPLTGQNAATAAASAPRKPR